MRNIAPPDAFPEKWEKHDSVQLPWMRKITLHFGYVRMRKFSELVAASAIGFALGALLKLTFAAQVGVLVALVATVVVLALLAQHTQARAAEYQESLIASMKVKFAPEPEPEGETDKQTPEETPTEPAPPVKET